MSSNSSSISGKKSFSIMALEKRNINPEKHSFKSNVLTCLKFYSKSHTKFLECLPAVLVHLFETHDSFRFFKEPTHALLGF